ncbi:MAG: hypothetical protein AB1714_10875 [Acidobacteriota bacterium]
MRVATYEGVVEEGRVRVDGNVLLPEHTRVFVVVPEVHVEQIAHVPSPRLAHPEEACDFRMEIIEDSSDARL